LINLCGMSLRLHADKSRLRGEIKSRTVVRMYRLSDIYTANESSLCFVGAGSVKGENVAVRDSWKQFAFEAQCYFLCSTYKHTVGR